MLCLPNNAEGKHIELDQSLLNMLLKFLIPDILFSVLLIFSSMLYRALHQGNDLLVDRLPL